jgi:hypothetical protein
MRNLKVYFGLGRHLMSAACLLFVLAATTSAYSIVMRGGKRIEIPAQFSVTNSTLSYEASPGFWITLQIATVDIPATERANNEKPGSLLGRATERALPRISARTSQAPQSKAARTVTNVDLEPFEQVRLKSERAYEQRLKEQGLPSMAVLRAQATADAQRFAEELAQRRAEAEAAERDAQLQAQIAALSAQLNALQSSGGEGSPVYADPYYYGGYPFFFGGSGGRSRVNSPLLRVPPGFVIGGAFGSLNIPLSSGRRNIIVAPGTRAGGHGGFGGGHNGGPRSH